MTLGFAFDSFDPSIPPEKRWILRPENREATKLIFCSIVAVVYVSVGVDRFIISRFPSPGYYASESLSRDITTMKHNLYIVVQCIPSLRGLIVSLSPIVASSKLFDSD